MPSDPLQSRLALWLEERLPLAAARELLARKIVPAHDQSIWYYLGGIILLAFFLLIGTGILLLLQYQPGLPTEAGAGGAHESIRRLVNDIPHGWWIRSIHHWSAHLMIAGVLLHLLSTLLSKAYRKPREFTWWTGLLLAALTMAAGFTGYLLPWNSLSFAATRVGAGIASATPLAGPLIQKLLLGGPDVSGATLTRFFGLHVVVIPLLILATTGIHLFMMICHGSSTPPSRETTPAGKPAEAVPFWPDFALRESRAWLIMLIGLLSVAAFLAPPVGAVADPLAPTPDDVKPEWYFLGFYRILKLLPTYLLYVEGLQWAVFASAILGATLVALPLLDAAPATTGLHSRRRSLWPGRTLLSLSAAFGWALSIIPTRSLPGWQQAGAIAFAGAAWLAVAVLLDRQRLKRPNAPATFFGLVLTSAMVGYLAWEAFGPVAALIGLAATWLCLGLIALRSIAARPAAAASLLAAFLAVIALGGELFTQHAHAAPRLAWRDRVSLTRVHETAPLFAAAILVLLLLLALVQLRIRHQLRLRKMGLRPKA